MKTVKLSYVEHQQLVADSELLAQILARDVESPSSILVLTYDDHVYHTDYSIRVPTIKYIGIRDGREYVEKECDKILENAKKFIRDNSSLTDELYEAKEKYNTLLDSLMDTKTILVHARSDKRWAVVTAVIFGVAFLISLIYG